MRTAAADLPAREQRPEAALPRITEIDYYAEPTRRFTALLGRPWHVLLDSGRGGGEAGRYDILAADPYITLETHGAITKIRGARGVETSERDPLELLKALLGASDSAMRRPPQVPFAGGAIGYFAYDLGRRYERLPALAAADIDVPEIAVGLYDWACVVDHAERRAWLVGTGRDERTFDEWGQLLDALQPPSESGSGSDAESASATSTVPGPVVDSGPGGGFPPDDPFYAPEHRSAAAADRCFVGSPVASSFDRAGYQRAFERIKAHIRAGDCYQVNLTQRFEAKASGPSWPAYLDLRRRSPAPFSAFLGFPDADLLSSSPERFLRVTAGAVETKPIKGTRPRSPDPAVDRMLADALRMSPKDRAENVMIVDLLRNDLGKACAPGSVRVKKLFHIESFANVHHLVSTVAGRLRPGTHALDLVRGAFPGGSITGAPKLRAMEIIEALEPHRRSVYCGAIGYVGFDGDMDLNIAIRTLLRRGDRIYAWAGGGIVADSELEAEYQESFDKAAALLAVLGGRSPR